MTLLLEVCTILHLTITLPWSKYRVYDGTSSPEDAYSNAKIFVVYALGNTTQPQAGNFIPGRIKKMTIDVFTV